MLDINIYGLYAKYLELEGYLMGEKKIPTSMRALNIAIGLIAVILSVVIVAYPVLAVYTMIIILLIALLLIGAARLIVGLLAGYLPKRAKAIAVVVGILAIAVAILGLTFPGLTTLVLIYLLSFGLLLNGIGRLAIGGSTAEYPGWLRVLLVAVGILGIALSFVVFAFPGFGFQTLVFLLSIGFLFNGIARIAIGLRGEKL